MNKKILSVLLLTVFIFSYVPLYSFAYEEDIEIEYSKSKKDYSSAGEETYKIEASDEQQKARDAAKKAYSAGIAYKSINMVPLFDSWTSKEAQAKINNIGMKLVMANELDDFVRFSVSRKEAVNATSSYDGEIKVYKGLLQYVETEDELAFVLAHELGHIYKKDSRTKIIRRGAAIGLIATGIVLAAAGGGSTQNTGGGLILAGSGAGLAEPKLSKKQESRADINGIDFMVKAGYNPLAAISIMNKILNRNWDIISTHPSGDKRMIWAYDYIEKNYPLYIDGGYDTISYQRAIKYIMARKAKKEAKKNQKEEKKIENKTEAEDI